MGRPRPFSRSTVLVVEDDDDQRSLAATVFEEAGFKVVECASAEAAGSFCRLLAIQELRLPAP